MRIVAIGDVGVLDGMIHIGDEAMLEEFVTQLRARGAAITAISANPDETADRYDIEAIERIGWVDPHDRLASAARRELVLRAARGDTSALPADDPAHAVIGAIRQSDGVAITGGGNLASTWPVHIQERSTIGAIAAILGVPLVVSGQTIGPSLSGEDVDLVRELLSSARRVGLREPASYALCRQIGVPAHLLHTTLDDASFLGIDDPLPTGEPYCLVSLSGHLGEAPREAALDALAALLDLVHAETGWEIAFLPHFGPLSGGDGELRGDDRIHAAVRERMTTGPGRRIPVTDSRTAASLARAAQLVVTSRYHPAVFAASAGVPTIGIPVDDYTGVKLTGALGNLGQSGILELAGLIGDLSTGRLADTVAGVLAEKDAIPARTADLIRSARAASAAWWDAIAADFIR